MRKAPLLWCAGLVLLVLLPSEVPAQYGDKGKLAVWGIKPVIRSEESRDNTHVRSVRVAKQKGFDRVVFEFDGVVPKYNIHYLKSRIFEDEGGRRKLKISGSAFVEIEMFVIPADDEQVAFSDAKDFCPKGRLKLPTVREIDDHSLFEGFYTFILGVNGRQPFRVTQLSHPGRLVIDFRH